MYSSRIAVASCWLCTRRRCLSVYALVFFVLERRSPIFIAPAFLLNVPKSIVHPVLWLATLLSGSPSPVQAMSHVPHPKPLSGGSTYRHTDVPTPERRQSALMMVMMVLHRRSCTDFFPVYSTSPLFFIRKKVLVPVPLSRELSAPASLARLATSPTPTQRETPRCLATQTSFVYSFSFLHASSLSIPSFLLLLYLRLFPALLLFLSSFTRSSAWASFAPGCKLSPSCCRFFLLEFFFSFLHCSPLLPSPVLSFFVFSCCADREASSRLFDSNDFGGFDGVSSCPSGLQHTHPNHRRDRRAHCRVRAPHSLLHRQSMGLQNQSRLEPRISSRQEERSLGSQEKMETDKQPDKRTEGHSEVLLVHQHFLVLFLLLLFCLAEFPF